MPLTHPIRIAAIAVFAATLLAPGAPVAGQVPMKDVRAVLATSKASDALKDISNQVIALVATSKPGRDSAVVNRAIRASFNQDTLLTLVAVDLRKRATPAVFKDLRGWLLSDSIRRLEARGDSAAAKTPLDQYVTAATTHMPAQDRLAVARRFADAQKSGDFYVTMINSVRHAASLIARKAGATAAVPQMLTAAQAAQIKQQAGEITVMSFLQRLEPLSNAESRRLTDAYDSPSGQWYVGAYTQSLASAISAAAAKAAAAIK